MLRQNSLELLGEFGDFLLYAGDLLISVVVEGLLGCGGGLRDLLLHGLGKRLHHRLHPFARLL